MHPRRKTVNTDDVLLSSRRNPDGAAIIKYSFEAFCGEVGFEKQVSFCGLQLTQKLRQVLVNHALANETNDGGHADESCNILTRIPAFKKEMKSQVEATVPSVRQQFNSGVGALPNRIISDCRSFPLYNFVRSLGTKLLVGTETRSPGQDIELVYEVTSDGHFASSLLECLEGWNGAPTMPRSKILLIDMHS